MRPLSVKRGLLAGSLATIVMILLGFFASQFGAPFLDWAKALAGFVGGHSVFGYLLFFSAGILISLFFAGFLHDRLPGTSWNRGLFFSIILWIGTGLLLAPIFGMGFFMENVVMALGTLVIYLVYGAVLGLVYDA